MSGFRLSNLLGFRLRPVGWLCLAVATLGTSAAEANSGALAPRDGDKHGVLSAQNSTVIEVEHANLTFDIRDSLRDASIEAVYRLVNRGRTYLLQEAAFAYVLAPQRGPAPPAMPIPEASVKVDGRSRDFRMVLDTDVVVALLREWLSAHPAIEAEARKLAAAESTGHRSLTSRASEAGASCNPYIENDGQVACGPNPSSRILAALSGPSTDTQLRYRRDEVFAAARLLIPDQLGALGDDWLILDSDEAMGWIVFDIDFEPGQARTVTLAYQDRARVNGRWYVNSVYSFDHLFSPAMSWAGFGSLDISVRAPNGTEVESSLPMQRVDGVWHSYSSALPDSEFTVHLMSRSGLWFGMRERSSYWTISVGCMAAASLITGGAIARLLRPAKSRVLPVLEALICGVVGAAAAMGVFWALQHAYPSRALLWYEDSLYEQALSWRDPVTEGLADSLPSLLRHRNYTTILGAFLAIAVFGPLAALVAAVSTVLARRRCRG